MGLEINISDISLIFGAIISLFVVLWGLKKALELLYD